MVMKWLVGWLLMNIRWWTSAFVWPLFTGVLAGIENKTRALQSAKPHVSWNGVRETPCLSVCLYVCMHIQIWIYGDTIYIYTCMHIWCISPYPYIPMYMYICIISYVCISAVDWKTHKHTCIHEAINLRIYVYMYTCWNVLELLFLPWPRRAKLRLNWRLPDPRALIS